MTTFSLEGRSCIALCDLLKISGCCDSGTPVKLVIDEDQVTVNDAVTTCRCRKTPAGRHIAYTGRRVTIAD